MSWFDEDGLAPRETSGSAVPILRLWAAVLKQGVEDAASGLRWKATNGKRKAKYTVGWHPDESILWLNSNARHKGSFLWCCDLFDLDPASVRGAVQSQWRTL